MNSRSDSISNCAGPVQRRHGYTSTEVVLLGVGSLSAAALLLILATAF